MNKDIAILVLAILLIASVGLYYTNPKITTVDVPGECDECEVCDICEICGTVPSMTDFRKCPMTAENN